MVFCVAGQVSRWPLSPALVALLAMLPRPRHRSGLLTRAGQARFAEATALWAGAQATFESVYGAERAAVLRDALRELTSDGFADKFAAGLRERPRSRRGRS